MLSLQASSTYMMLSKNLRQCEFYFRRYPFRGMPVSKADHIRNICEMYFAQFYVMRSRIKTCLNLMSDLLRIKPMSESS